MVQGRVRLDGGLMERCPFDLTLMGEWTLQRPPKCRQRGSTDDVSKTGSSPREEDVD